MHRLGVLLVVVAAWAQPVHAADMATSQQEVKQQLTAASAKITQLNLQMATLEKSVADTQQRIERERAQVRLLARALYAQPDSLVGLLFESSSISEALTRIGDMTSAGDRAAATKRSLDHDLSNLSTQRAQLQSDRDQTEQLKSQLQAQFSKLIAQAGPAPAPGRPPTGLDPASVAAIQQMILDAFAPLGAAAQTWAMRVAKCESNYNPYAVNPSSGASGLFQFLPSTWRATPQAQAGKSVWDPAANAQAAAWLYNRSGPNQWSCK